jgi:serine/threonine protein kinase
VPNLQEGGAFGAYQLVRLLGRGGFAEVWLAHAAGKQGFARRVALKVLHPGRVGDPHSMEGLINEARLGGTLEHPDIVQVLAIDEVEGDWFIAMEYVEGSDLGSLLKRLTGSGLRMPPSVVIDVGLHVARALDYAHNATDLEGRPLDLVHRDLKPQNILLSRSGAVKVADFGIAKATTNLNSTSTGTLKGTPLYMAPELWAGERIFHPRSDLFALGAILVELATGQRLLHGDSPAAVAGQAVFGDPEEEAGRLADVLPEATALVTGLLQRKPEKRIQSAAEVVAELQAIARQVEAPADLPVFVKLVETLELPAEQRGDAVATLGLPSAHDQAWTRLITAARGQAVEPDPVLTRPSPSHVLEGFSGAGSDAPTRRHPASEPEEPARRTQQVRWQGAPPTSRRRTATLAVVAAVAVLVLWFAWPRPDAPGPAPSPTPVTSPAAERATPTPAPTPSAIVARTEASPTPAATAAATPTPIQETVADPPAPTPTAAPVRGPGCLAFSSHPSGAEVTVDGRSAGVAKRARPTVVSFPAGPATVEMAVGGGERIAVEVEAGVRLEVRCDAGLGCTTRRSELACP